MNKNEYESYVKLGYKRIPLTMEVVADLETPLSVYSKLCYPVNEGRNSFILESVTGGENVARYSFIGLPAKTTVRSFGRKTEVLNDGRVTEVWEGDPLEFIESFHKRLLTLVPKNLPRFCGGLAGYFGYDTVRHIEKKLANTSPPDPLGLPDIHLILAEEIVVFDRLTGRLYIVIYINVADEHAYEAGMARLEHLRSLLNVPANLPSQSASHETDIVRLFDRTAYMSMVEEARQRIHAGDLMQVQLGQRLIKHFPEPPISLYRALRLLNPSPYMYFYDFEGVKVVGASPEILVRKEQRNTSEGDANIVTIRPLAGTRPRGKSPSHDAMLSREMLEDPKEVAEHVMLIDLARNDIGRIAEIGSVAVTEKMSVEKYSHVQHIVSSVEGRLKTNLSNMDVLRATFPAGTLSGAPKVKAMEIIDELEPVRRGIYSGAVGYMSFNNEMDLAIAIRTGIIKDKLLIVQASAGIVADSDPATEWAETEAKARAVLQAAELVQKGIEDKLY